MSDAGLPADRPKSKLRGCLVNFALFGIITVICILLLEGAVRRFLPFYSPSAQLRFHRVDEKLVLGPLSRTVRIATPKGDFDTQVTFNAEGFRDRKDFRTATDDDWIALGDSMTMGWGVEEEERFSDLLERAFATNGLPARVFNVAVPENIIGYQRLLARAENRGAKARHIIVGLCMENDLRDYSDGSSSWDAVEAPHHTPGTIKEDVRRWLLEHSGLYVAASFGLQKSPLMRGWLTKLGVARSLDRLVAKNEWSEQILKTSHDELVKLVAGRDALIMIVPARRLWSGNNSATELRVHETLVGSLRESGLEVLDLKPAFEAGGDPMSLYFKTDSHWNARGHALAAQELFKAIATRRKGQ